MKLYTKTMKAESLNPKRNALVFNKIFGLQRNGPPWFEAKDIKKILGIDKNKLFYWIRTYRLLKPDVEGAEGPGTRTKFSPKNLLELALIQELAQFGMDLNGIKKIKKVLENTKIVFSQEYKKRMIEKVATDKEWIEIIENLSYYDLAFIIDYPMGLTIYKDKDNYLIKRWELSRNAPEEDEKKEILEHISVLKINIKALAKSLREKI